MFDRFADAASPVDQQRVVIRLEPPVDKDEIQRKLQKILSGLRRRKLEHHHIIHHSGPVPHHLPEIGAEIIRAAGNRVIAGGKQAAFQIVHFLQEHLRLEIRGENPD